MALTGKVEPQFRCQNQVEHLALTHTPMGIAAMTLAKKAREQGSARANILYAPGEDEASENELAPLRSYRQNDFALLSARDLQTQLARQKLAAREMTGRIEALSARAADADKRYGELEDELNVARDEILLQQNDKHALQASLDLLVSENARLSQRLAEREAALEQAYDRVEQVKAALDAAQTAHSSLSAGIEEANRKHQTAEKTLNTVRLECRKLTAAFSTLHRKRQTESNNLKATKIERDKLLAALDRTNQKFLASSQKLKALQAERGTVTATLHKLNERHRAEIDKLKSCLDSATSRAVAAEILVAKVREILLEKFAQLQASVETKNCELHDLERSHLRLIDGTKMLLEIFAMRDTALARADARIRFLSDRIGDLEAESYRSRAWQGLEVDNGVRSASLEQELPGNAAQRTDANSDDVLTGGGRPSESPGLYLTSTMLATTITF